jgi:hypothetical protein
VEEDGETLVSGYGVKHKGTHVEGAPKRARALACAAPRARLARLRARPRGGVGFSALLSPTEFASKCLLHSVCAPMFLNVMFTDQDAQIVFGRPQLWLIQGEENLPCKRVNP